VTFANAAQARVLSLAARRALDALNLATLTDASELHARWQATVDLLLKAPARQACTPLIEAIAEMRDEPDVALTRPCRNLAIYLP
jgi:hypothetical protein